MATSDKPLSSQPTAHSAYEADYTVQSVNPTRIVTRSFNQGKPSYSVFSYNRYRSPLDIREVSCVFYQDLSEAARSESDLHAKMNAFRLNLLSSKDKARSFLQRAGILDNNGELAEPYRPA